LCCARIRLMRFAYIGAGIYSVASCEEQMREISRDVELEVVTVVQRPNYEFVIEGFAYGQSKFQYSLRHW